MKHPSKDHSLYSIDMIEELVEEFTQRDSSSDNMQLLLKFLICFHRRILIKSVNHCRELKTTRTIRIRSKPRSRLTRHTNQQPPPRAGGDIVEGPLGTQEGNRVENFLPSKNKLLHLRLNPTILGVVKKEVTKLLIVGIIYPISDSNLVSLVQVMPKKFGMTIAKNWHAEMVLNRIQNSWRVCIDYRKLNLATRKDHFPLPFIDQVLEKLVRKSHYYILDEYSGYMQIHIAPEDQHKTTLTCPFGTFAYTRMSFGLYNAPSTFQICMLTIFSDLLEE
ncbi:hypothetical protein CR513_06540, partial [Mucuna pruriens]